MILHKYVLPVAAAILLAAAATVAHWSAKSPSAEAAPFAGLSGSTEAATDLGARVHQLENTLNQTLKIQGQLLELVNELSNRLDPGSDNLETRHASASVGESAPTNNARPARSRHQSRFERQRETQMRQLTDAGFSAERAAFIVDKQARIQYEQMQFSYEYHHLQDKRSERARELQTKLQTYSNPRRVFEQELSNAEFEQYLEAFGGRTTMEIGDMLESAPAYEAGLRPGDKIIRYNNQRVFHMGDLRTQVYQAEPGSSVAVEIQRKGSSAPETIYLPAGPLGIRG
ncbi:PDZ domain-containing protein [Microbulbifer sp. Q7]|uniref:PDZ domain-containing protein n=1 Tax=Microbulbifer sp. Q7 TaxID=1785091 RepID=UPI00082D608A|nr:PDZ domain-containing protein [Microbulbifer sp. Q7]